MAEPHALPPEPEWPVPWQAVEGSDDGLAARASYQALRAFMALARTLPDGPVDLLLGGLARLGRRFDRRHSDAARAFLRQAFGDVPRAELERRVLAAWRHLFRVTLDYERFARRVPLERTLEHFDIRWTADVRRVLAGRTGAVLVTGHVGNWEVSIGVGALVGFAPVYAIARPPKNRPLSIATQRLRESRRVRLLPRHGAMKLAPAVIRAGGSLGMLLDQRARQKPVFAPFFGRPARCDRSAAILLKRFRVPVVIAAAYMTERPLHYRVEFPAVLFPAELEGAGAEEVMARVNGHLEELILACPDQYLWLHDRYHKTPLEMPVEGAESTLGAARRAGGSPTGGAEAES